MKRAVDGEPAAKRKKAGVRQYKKKVEEDNVTRVAFPSAERAPQLTLSADRLTVHGTTSGGGGYRMARASHGVSTGCWYWECTINPGGDGARYRLGWATKKAPLQAPVGYDRWSYGYRDAGGSAVHASRRVDGYGDEFGPGDVIGCMIVFGDDGVEDTFADAPDPDTTEPPDAEGLDPAALHTSNYVRFFKNGVDQGVAFRRIPPGTYFPAVSVFRGGSATADFGPDFAVAPSAIPLREGPAHRGAERDAKAIAALIPPPPTAEEAAAAEAAALEKPGGFVI